EALKRDHLDALGLVDAYQVVAHDVGVLAVNRATGRRALLERCVVERFGHHCSPTLNTLPSRRRRFNAASTSIAIPTRRISAPARAIMTLGSIESAGGASAPAYGRRAPARRATPLAPHV